MCIRDRTHRYHYQVHLSSAGPEFRFVNQNGREKKKEHDDLFLILHVFEGKNAQFCFQRRQISLTSSSMHFFSNFANISLAFVSALCSFSSHSFFVGRLRLSEMKSINWQNQGIHIYLFNAL